ncbi:MAG: hypothetical protein J6B04_05310 [Clostridia bacterium]|nr:hypothetical protein [Clostridia bacterium]
MKAILHILKIVAWLAISAFIVMLYCAFFTGFFDAIERGDTLNIIGMPPFIGAAAIVHYLILWVVNRFLYHDELVLFKLFTILKEKGIVFAIVFFVAAIILSPITAVAVAIVHLYLTILIIGIVKPKKVSYGYKPKTPTTKNNFNTKKDEPRVTKANTYNFESYKNYLNSNFNAASINVDYGYTKFVRAARITSLDVYVTSGETPEVKVNATVTLIKNNAEINAYIGTDSHHNSTAANSTVVDSEISQSREYAESGAKRAIEARIRSLTSTFAAQNNSGPDSVNENANVSVVVS